MVKIIYTIALLISGVVFLSAQNEFQPHSVDSGNKGIIYNQEFAIGVKIHTNGFAIGLDLGKLKSYNKTTFLHFDIGEIHHPKETRQSFDFPSTITGKVSKAFKFGKRNNFYVLRAGLGKKRYFSEKAKRKGAAIGITYEGGFSLGLLKPYYLELFPVDGSPNSLPVSTKYSKENHDRFTDIFQIYGASGFTKGLSELSPVPGIHGSLAVHFDWGAFDEYLKALEVGVMLDFFTEKVPIMVEVDDIENNPYFINFFVNIQFGKRY